MDEPRMKPRTIILGAPGTNRKFDLGFAFERSGSDVTYIEINELPDRQSEIKTAQIIAIAGGFSYADALGSGRVFANELMHRVGDVLRERISHNVPILGICNGFQVLVRTGLLPGTDTARVHLAHNERGTFECRWVSLRSTASRCVWTKDLAVITCPVAHGEGRLVGADDSITVLEDGGHVALRYVRPDGSASDGVYPFNPNGSSHDIAGITDVTGLVLGMMPHPENHVTARQGRSGSPTGIAGLSINLFINGVQHASNR